MIAIGIIFMIMTLQLPNTESQLFDSRFMPMVTAIIMIVMGIPQLIQNYNQEVEKSSKKDNKTLMITVILLVFYVLLYGRLGFVVTSAVSEAFTLAKKAGVDPELVYNAIRGGLAGSTVMDAKGPMMLERNFEPGFRIELHIKDLQNALDTSHSVGSSLPLTAGIMEIMQSLSTHGSGTDDHSAIVKYYEMINDVKVGE